MPCGGTGKFVSSKSIFQWLFCTADLVSFNIKSIATSTNSFPTYVYPVGIAIRKEDAIGLIITLISRG
jgi:hypothetical protein